MDPLLQDREIAAYELDVEARAERARSRDDGVLPGNPEHAGPRPAGRAYSRK